MLEDSAPGRGATTSPTPWPGPVLRAGQGLKVGRLHGRGAGMDPPEKDADQKNLDSLVIPEVPNSDK